MEIVLRDDGATLTVAPRKDGLPAAARIVLLPDSRQKLTQSEMTDPNMTASFGNLAPGRYRVLALDADSNPEYASPKFQQEYSAQWQEVTLAANQRSTISVELTRRAE